MNRLKELRFQKRLSQADLAKIVNVKQNTISNWEKSKTEIDTESLKKLADYFEVTVDFLLGRKEKSPTANDEAKSGLSIPEKYKDILIALNNGDNELEQEDIDDIARFIEFTKNKKK